MPAAAAWWNTSAASPWEMKLSLKSSEVSVVRWVRLDIIVTACEPRAKRPRSKLDRFLVAEHGLMRVLILRVAKQTIHYKHKRNVLE
jgi:hypothetical protein